MPLGRCKDCRAPVRFVKTEAGKSMPLDPVAVPDGNVIVIDGVAYVRKRDGWVLPLGAHGYEENNTYTPHFATCPNRKR